MTLRTVTWIFWLATVLGHHQLRSDTERGPARIKGRLLTLSLLYALAALASMILGRGVGVWGLAGVVLLFDVALSFSFDWLGKFTHVSAGKRGRAGLYLSKEMIRIVGVILITQLWPFVTPPLTPTPDWLTQTLRWALLLVLVTKPANTVFKHLFARFQIEKPAEKNGEKAPPVEGAGAVIGNLERVISAILFSMGQFAVVAIIYTAKSIARFDRISKDQAFAEYYLIGTLYSILYILIVWLTVLMFLT